MYKYFCNKKNYNLYENLLNVSWQYNWQNRRTDLFTFQAMKAMTANYTESSPFDWAGMMKNMNMMMTLYSNPESMTTDYPIVTLLSMNMSLLDETMKVVMYNLQQMTVQNVTE